MYGKSQRIQTPELQRSFNDRGYASGKQGTRAIAEVVGCSQRTIQRELERGRVQQLDVAAWLYYETYSAEKAQKDAALQATGKGPGLKIGKDHRLVATIERCIRAGESPDMITHRISSEAEADSVTLCTSIIYRYLYANLFLHVSWQDLILGPYKKRQSRRYNRPSYHKTQASVVQALDRIERELRAKGFRDTFRTITVDNGSEFLGTPELERSCQQRNKQRT